MQTSKAHAMDKNVSLLFDAFRTHRPKMLPGIEVARAPNPEYFDRIGGELIELVVKAYGEKHLKDVVEAYTLFTIKVNTAQLMYEDYGRYAPQSFDEVEAAVYSKLEYMTSYLLGVLVTTFAWEHHLRLVEFFEKYFIEPAAEGKILEIAPGHGGWGLMALKRMPKMTLSGYDISEASMVIARKLSAANGFGARATYAKANALELDRIPSGGYSHGISCFLIEHLPEPVKLLTNLYHHVKPGGRVFLTGALTAAQEDHIYEFRRETEIMQLAEIAGFRVVASLSDNPSRRIKKGATFIPRSMAMVLVRHD
ncbi:MAG: class I SAM-dependent methyltransferase [Hyphomicrobiaceae bacterium]